MKRRRPQVDVRLQSTDGTVVEYDRNSFNELFNYFKTTGATRSVPFSTEDLEMLNDFIEDTAFTEETVGRIAYPLSRLQPLVEHLGVKNSEWRRVATVDENVEDRWTALYQLGYDARRNPSAPPYVNDTRHDKLPYISQIYNLIYDPAWPVPDVLARPSGWDDKVKEEALKIEWISVLCGIAQDAWLRFTADYPEVRGTVRPSIPTEYINWGDVAAFVPILPSIVGVPTPRSSHYTYRDQLNMLNLIGDRQRTAIFHSEAPLLPPEARMAGTISTLLARGDLPSEVAFDVVRSPFDCPMTMYKYNKLNMSGLEIYGDIIPYIYSRTMKWYGLRARTADSNEARDILLKCGLLPLTDRGKRTGVNVLFDRNPRPSEVRARLAQYGLISPLTGDEWDTYLLDHKSLPAAYSKFVEYGLLGSISVTPEFLGDDSEYGLVSKSLGLNFPGGRIGYEDLVRNVMNGGYVSDLVPTAYTPGQEYEVSIAYLPLVVNTQILVRHPNSKSINIVPASQFESVATYMLEKLGYSVTEAIAEVLVSYQGYTDDSHSLAFLNVLLPLMAEYDGDDAVVIPE